MQRYSNTRVILRRKTRRRDELHRQECWHWLSLSAMKSGADIHPASWNLTNHCWIVLNTVKFCVMTNPAQGFTPRSNTCLCDSLPWTMAPSWSINFKNKDIKILIILHRNKYGKIATSVSNVQKNILFSPCPDFQHEKNKNSPILENTYFFNNQNRFNVENTLPYGFNIRQNKYIKSTATGPLRAKRGNISWWLPLLAKLFHYYITLRLKHFFVHYPPKSQGVLHTFTYTVYCISNMKLLPCRWSAVQSEYLFFLSISLIMYISCIYHVLVVFPSFPLGFLFFLRCFSDWSAFGTGVF